MNCLFVIVWCVPVRCSLCVVQCLLAALCLLVIVVQFMLFVVCYVVRVDCCRLYGGSGL